MLHALPLSRSLPHHSHRLRNPERIEQVASRGFVCSGQQHDFTIVDRFHPGLDLVRCGDYAVASGAPPGLASVQRWLNGRVACLCTSRITHARQTQRRSQFLLLPFLSLSGSHRQR